MFFDEKGHQISEAAGVWGRGATVYALGPGDLVQVWRPCASLGLYFLIWEVGMLPGQPQRQDERRRLENCPQPRTREKSLQPRLQCKVDFSISLLTI